MAFCNLATKSSIEILLTSEANKPILMNDWFEPRPAENLLLHAGQPFIHVRRIYRLHKLGGNRRLLDKHQCASI